MLWLLELEQSTPVYIRFSSPRCTNLHHKIHGHHLILRFSGLHSLKILLVEFVLSSLLFYPEHEKTQAIPRIIIISSSSCHAISTDIPNPLLPPLPIVHWVRQVLRATPYILTELLLVGSSWSPLFCSAMWRGP